MSMSLPDLVRCERIAFLHNEDDECQNVYERRPNPRPTTSPGLPNLPRFRLHQFDHPRSTVSLISIVEYRDDGEILGTYHFPDISKTTAVIVTTALNAAYRAGLRDAAGHHSNPHVPHSGNPHSPVPHSDAPKIP